MNPIIYDLKTVTRGPAPYGDGQLIPIHGEVNTLMLPLLTFTVARDQKHLLPGNVVLLNGVRYGIYARRPEHPQLGVQVELILFRDYSTRRERLAQQRDPKRLRGLLLRSYERAKAEQQKTGYPVPRLESSNEL